MLLADPLSRIELAILLPDCGERLRPASAATPAAADDDDSHRSASFIRPRSRLTVATDSLPLRWGGRFDSLLPILAPIQHERFLLHVVSLFLHLILFTSIVS